MTLTTTTDKPTVQFRHACWRCNGSGVVTERAADSGDATNTDCPDCDGRGTTDRPTYPCPLPEQHAPFRATDAIRAMNAAGRTEMIHYAGAAHRDLVAWHVTRAWLDQPTRTESECKSIALWRAWGVTLSPEQIRATNPGMR